MSIISPRTGRPKIDNPKNIDVKVRIDRATNERLLEYCEKHKISRTEAIRKGIHLVLSENKSDIK